MGLSLFGYSTWEETPSYYSVWLDQKLTLAVPTGLETATRNYLTLSDGLLFSLYQDAMFLFDFRQIVSLIAKMRHASHEPISQGSMGDAKCFSKFTYLVMHRQ